MPDRKACMMASIFIVLAVNQVAVAVDYPPVTFQELKKACFSGEPSKVLTLIINDQDYNRRTWSAEKSLVLKAVPKYLRSDAKKIVDVLASPTSASLEYTANGFCWELTHREKP
jgi:hypothetical protein